MRFCAYFGVICNMPGTTALPARRPHRIPHRTPRTGHRSAVWSYLRANPVLLIAATLALLSCVIVPPDAQYLSYIDFKTLTCLFCTLAVICALKNIRFFTIVADKIIRTAGNMRTAAIALVYITFIGSMLIANDMALLTFLPLGYFVLSTAKQERHMALIFILQNLAANLGGMLTPFGNPQNLYLYEKFRIPDGEFVAIMAAPFVLSIVLITACCFVFPKEPLSVPDRAFDPLPVGRTALYVALFLFSILLVFRVVPFWVGLAVTIPVLLVMDRNALQKVDYGLLLTFVSFFVLAGNVARIGAVQNFFAVLLERNVLLVSAACCQCISNVPSAILLSQFTTDYRALLMGVNIGGAGTLIASLASLITFREYTTHCKHDAARYIGLFSFINFGFLIILAVFCSFLL